MNQSRRLLQSYGVLPYNAPMPKPATTARLEARLPAEVHALLKRAAEIEGRSLTDFVVSAAQEAARKTIEETSIIKLSAEDQQRFAEALIDPAPLTPAMERAVSHHRRLIGRRE
ncbi:MAG: DUF1778 domain-containing protein [Rhodomicrobium sp.]